MQSIMKILVLVSQITELLQILESFPILIHYIPVAGTSTFSFLCVIGVCAFCSVHKISAICDTGNLAC